MVFTVELQMPGKLINPLGQNRDLHHDILRLNPKLALAGSVKIPKGTRIVFSEDIAPPPAAQPKPEDPKSVRGRTRQERQRQLAALQDEIARGVAERDQHVERTR